MMRHVATLAVAALVVVGSAGRARADSYRGELLAADATAVTVAAISRGEGPLRYVGGAGLWLSSPLVHAAHGNFGRAAGALALRGGSALTTLGFALWCLDDGDEGGKVAGCVLGSMALGVVLVGGAFAIDYAILADDPDPDPAPALMTWGGEF